MQSSICHRRQHSLETVASPLTLSPLSSPSHLSCTCPSQAFYFLQSPSAFSSFSSEDASLQIDVPEPLLGSLESADLCPSHLPHCYYEASIESIQDCLPSPNKLGVAESPKRPVLRSTNIRCQISVRPNSCAVVQEGRCLELLESELQDHVKANTGKMKTLVPSLSQDVEEYTQDNAGSDNDAKETQGQTHRQLSDIKTITDDDHHSCYAYPKAEEGGDWHWNCNYRPHHDAEEGEEYHDSVNFRPLQDVCAVLRRSEENVTRVKKPGGKGEGKENSMQADSNGKMVDELKLSECLTTLCPAFDSPSCMENLKQVGERKNGTHSGCGQVAMNSTANFRGSQGCGQSRKRFVGEVEGGGACGWVCPRDGKKSFKSKPRQVLLDKWLAKQR